jgi:dTDP-4-amino-4,6-dideoxygalactose transaminase
VERAEILRDKGTNRKKFLRGQVDKYTWVDIGSSYLPSDVLAAILLAQLEARESIITKRRRVWNYYDAHLAEWAAEHGIRRPTVPPHAEQSFHMYYLLMANEQDRTSVIESLKRKGILSVFHYVPLHLSEMGERFGGSPGQCPVTEELAPRLVRLPFFNDLTEAEQASVVDALLGTDLSRQAT